MVMVTVTVMVMVMVMGGEDGDGDGDGDGRRGWQGNVPGEHAMPTRAGEVPLDTLAVASGSKERRRGYSTQRAHTLRPAIQGNGSALRMGSHHNLARINARMRHHALHRAQMQSPTPTP
eukprot:364483-Chlamydomonas_euryale.AAC.2